MRTVHDVMDMVARQRAESAYIARVWEHTYGMIDIIQPGMPIDHELDLVTQYYDLAHKHIESYLHHLHCKQRNKHPA